MKKAKKPLLLIVDDSPENLQVLANVLEKHDYETALASSGPQALEFLKKEKPELILLDVMMPIMTGFEVCKKLKANPESKNIPVIFLTAKVDIENVVKGFELGAVDYITKPFYSAELLARIRTHIELKKAREEIKTLRGIIPICTKCKKIRDDKGFWNQVEEYIQERTEADFTHSLCPICIEKIYPQYKKLKKKIHPRKSSQS